MNKWSNYGKWRHPEKRKELMKIDVEDFNNKAQHIIDTVVKPQVERYEQAKKQKETMTEANEAGYNEAPKFSPSQNNPPYISDDFQIGPDGAYEQKETMTEEELQNFPQMMSSKMVAQQQLINLLYSQVIDLTMMSKIELGDDVIAEIKRLNEIINE